jgi:RNA polymerase sigma-70 factor (ECF subfamily)
MQSIGPQVAGRTHSSTAQDDDILELIARRDFTGALRRLMRRHGTAVYRYCREELHDAALADDVHQQVFIAAFRGLAAFRGGAQLRTWLFAIARHRMLDAVKSRRRADAVFNAVDTEGRAAAVDPAPPVGESLDDARLRAALMQCLDELRAPVRTAVVLRFQQGFTFDELGEVCHEKPGTVQAQVARALPMLRDCIERRTGGLV